jgi:DNA-binding transcriptional MerR regulator
MNPLSQLYTIQQISQKCDVPKSTLRFWEKQLGPLFSPIRSPGGQRRYVQEHIDLIGRIKQLQADGLSLHEMRQALAQTMPPDPELTAVGGLDRLADRVAELVKEEVYRFLREGPITNLSEKNIIRNGTGCEFSSPGRVDNVSL